MAGKGQKTDVRQIWFPRQTYLLPAQLEEMLEQAEMDGWRPKHMDFFRLTLEKSEKRSVCYVCDAGKPSEPHHDHGWELAGRMGNAWLWRREYTGIKPRSFANAESLIGMVRRSITVISVTFITASMTAMMCMLFAILLRVMLPPWLLPILFGASILLIAVAILFGRAFWSLCKTVEKIDQNNNINKK